MKHHQRLRAELQALRAESDALAAIIDMAPVGLAWLDPGGRVLHVNAALRTLQRRTTGAFRIRAGRMTWKEAAAQDQFDALLRGAMRNGAGAAEIALGTGRVLATAHAMDHLPPSPLLPSERRILVQVAYAEAGIAPPLPLLQRALGLTAAEARLVRALWAERRLAPAASAAGITVNTARSYLKRIFLKTGTQRQPQLIALVQRVWHPAAAAHTRHIASS